jgi:TolA-binding protein
MKFKFHSLIAKILSIVLFAGLFYSCGVWHNFTTYFNLYYDASDFFNKAEKEINLQKRDLFSTDDIKIPQNANSDLQKVIEKCSQILQFHQNSSYVDDALLMLGKSFYYQANYRKALRKFNELIVTQPHSDLILETNLWVGKTQLGLKDYEDALTTLKTVRKEAIKEDEKQIVQDSFIEEIKYNIAQDNYPDAISLAGEFLKYSDDDKINAQIAYEMGILYEESDSLKQAIASFKKVQDYSPTYETLFNSRIELGKVLRQDKQYQNALDVYNEMRSEKKYADSFNDIDLERGITLLKMDKTEDAVDILLTVDTSKTRTPSQGLASFQLGEVFKNHYKNFDSALVFYNRTVSSTAPKDTITEARNNVTLLDKFKTVYGKLKHDKKELSYALDPELFRKDSIAYQLKLQSEEEAEYAKENHYLGKSAVPTIKDTGKAYYSILARDSILVKLVKDSTLSKDSLHIIDSTLAVDSAKIKSLNNTFPRRELPIAENESKFNKPESRERNFRDVNPRDHQRNKPKAIKEKPPERPTEPVDTLKYHIIQTEFNLGNILFTEFNFPDSAYSYYNDILTNYPNSPFQARVLFAVGSYYLTINDSVKADSLFNIIYNNYKNERIVNAAADKLGKPLIDFNYDPAQPMYVSASDKMQKAKYDSSITDFYNIYLTHPQSPYAAKALYTTGWILENKMNLNDSAVVVYDTLIKRYPHSEYTTNIKPRVIFYKNEMERIKKAHNDSLKSVESGKTGTLASDSLGNGHAELKNNQNGSSELALKNEGKPKKTPAQVEADRLKIKEFLDRANAKANANPDTLIRIRGNASRHTER